MHQRVMHAILINEYQQLIVSNSKNITIKIILDL